jgi:putative endonuclease
VAAPRGVLVRIQSWAQIKKEKESGERVSPHSFSFSFSFSYCFRWKNGELLPYIFSLSLSLYVYKALLMRFFVYILYSPAADKFYVGQTNDLAARLNRHNAGFNTSTKPYIPWTLKLALLKSTRSEAMQAEKKLKHLSKERIKAFIAK